METTQFETCIVCGKLTNTPIDMHIDYRTGYIEGAGQLCHSCWTKGTDRRQILILTSMIYNTPNDQELGNKVRRIYNELEGE